MMVLAVSHNTGDPTPHLRAEAARMAELQQAGLVECRKAGRWHYYRLAGRGAPELVRETIRWAMKSLAEQPQASQDRQRLQHVQRKAMDEVSRCYRK